MKITLGITAAVLVGGAVVATRTFASPPAPSGSSAEAAPAQRAGQTQPGSQSGSVAGDTKGANFNLTPIPKGDCRPGAECLLVLRLQADGQYHINQEYPYKFKANDVAGVEFLGKGEKNVFSKAQGDFKSENEKIATMDVRFKPTAKGAVSITGPYKLSVCSQANCQLESVDVVASVTVK